MVDITKTPYGAIFGKAVKMFQESIPINMKDEDRYWNDTVDRMENFIKPYADTPFYNFACDAAFMVFNEVERVYRKAKEKEDEKELEKLEAEAETEANKREAEAEL